MEQDEGILMWTALFYQFTYVQWCIASRLKDRVGVDSSC